MWSQQTRGLDHSCNFVQSFSICCLTIYLQDALAPTTIPPTTVRGCFGPCRGFGRPGQGCQGDQDHTMVRPASMSHTVFWANVSSYFQIWDQLNICFNRRHNSLNWIEKLRQVFASWRRSCPAMERKSRIRKKSRICRATEKKSRIRREKKARRLKSLTPEVVRTRKRKRKPQMTKTERI